MIKIVRHKQDIKQSDQGAVIALGNFDGIHLGHQALIKQAKEIALKEKKKLAILSFHPHPLTFLKKVNNIRIQSLREKIQILEQLGVDFIFIQRFSAKFSDLSAHEFLHNFLSQDLAISHIIVGDDFIFGKNRSGSVALLEEKAPLLGYKLSKIALQKRENSEERFSSTKIRQYLAAGNIKAANQLIGRPYSSFAKIVKGRQEGRKLGFKTANLLLTNLFHPKYGVYAAFAYISGRKYQAVVNFGIRPSFLTTKEAVLEAHILDFEQDIYGQYLKLDFIEFIRCEQKFSSLAELTRQITNDIEQAKIILNDATN